jgi:hypothetical protein
MDSGLRRNDEPWMAGINPAMTAGTFEMQSFFFALGFPL